MFHNRTKVRRLTYHHLVVDRQFSVPFPNGRVAHAIRVQDPARLAAAVRALGLPVGRPTLVLVGGATGLSPLDLDQLRPLLHNAVGPVTADVRATILDGGTDSGVMRLMGETHSEHGLTTPLVGIAAEGTVRHRFPGNPSRCAEPADLESHHTHFIFVPGRLWGDESPWIARAAGALADGAPSGTLLLNGGAIAQQDVANSVSNGRQVIIVAGSGRTADVLVDAMEGAHVDDETRPIVASGLVHSIALSDGPTALAEALRRILQPHATGPTSREVS